MRASSRVRTLFCVGSALLSTARLIAAEDTTPTWLKGSDDDDSHQRSFGTLSWSVVLPVLSVSFLSWVIKNGTRCCMYDEETVLNEIVHCNFGPLQEPNMTETSAEDIELESVPPGNFQIERKISRNDLVERGISLTCDCTETGADNVNDSSFSWIKGSGNANYLNMD
jgi:hypothetical protein